MAIEYAEDNCKIKIGDNLYPLDLTVDAAVSAAASVAIVAGIAAVAPASWVVGLALVGGGATNYLYSKFIDPIVEDTIVTLVGKDEIVLLGQDNNVLCGMIYSQSIPGNRADAVHALIAHAKLAGISSIGRTIELHTSIWPSLDYKVSGADVFKAVAAQTGMPFLEFLLLSASGRDYGNNEFYSGFARPSQTS